MGFTIKFILGPVQMLPFLQTGEENSQTEFGNLPLGKSCLIVLAQKVFIIHGCSVWLVN